MPPNALADNPLVYRNALLPVGLDAQGGAHAAVPGMVTGLADSASRLFGSGEFWNGPRDPQAADDARNVLGAVYAGSSLATRPANALSAGAARVYRGAGGPEEWPHPTGELTNITGHKYPARFWASDSPDVADMYAGKGPTRSVTPADVDFKNPLVIDAGGAGFPEIPWEGRLVTTDELANVARDRGHDGLVVKNVRDGGTDPGNPGGKPATVYAALGPGTVRSAETGKVLFSGGGAPAASQQFDLDAYLARGGT